LQKYGGGGIFAEDYMLVFDSVEGAMHPMMRAPV
jgi:hypothetical protein